MASEQHFCERHGRPAVASRVRIRPDGSREVEYLCDIDLAEERMSRGGFGGRSFFDDFFSDFFGDAPAGGRMAPRQQQRQANVVRHVLEQADADPDAIAAQLEEEAEKGQQTDVAPSLSPDAKAALIAAYEESRELGASYVGPEHVLLALAHDTETEAGQLLERVGLSHTKP